MNKGANVVILENVHIGNNVSIGAVVIIDIADDIVLVGVLQK